MGVIAQAVREFRDLTESQWLLKALGSAGSQTATGRSVGVMDSLHNPTVWAAVDYLSSTIGSLSLHTYRTIPNGGKEKATDNPLYSLLYESPNPEMTSQEYWEAVIGHVELWGNHCSEIEINGAGDPIALWPLRPDRMRIFRDPETRRLVYEYTLPTGQTVRMREDQVLHIRNYSLDGITGLSRIAMAREGIGLALAAEEHGARFFGNDSTPSGYLQAPKSLSDGAFKRLKESWEDAHKGLKQAWRVAVLEEDVKWQSIGLPNKDAQWLEMRQFQKDEIASIMRVKPHKIGNLNRATFSNIESQAIESVTDDIRPRCRRIEQRLGISLFARYNVTPAQRRKRIYAEFNVDSLLRGDSKARSELYASGLVHQWLTPNEVRDKENLNPVEWGDVPIQAQNILGSGVKAPAGDDPAVEEGPGVDEPS